MTKHRIPAWSCPWGQRVRFLTRVANPHRNIRCIGKSNATLGRLRRIKQKQEKIEYERFLELESKYVVTKMEEDETKTGTSLKIVDSKANLSIPKHSVPGTYIHLHGIHEPSYP